MVTIDQNIENLFKSCESEAMRVTSDASEVLKKPSDFVSASEAVQDNTTREELIILAESGKIKYTVNYIKKASNAALGKIKADYERKHLDETNDYVANNILSSITKLLKYFELVKNPDELEQDLKENYLLKRDVKNIVGMVTPGIPYVGLLCGGATVGKHVAMNTFSSDAPARPSEPRCEAEASRVADE